MLVIGPVLIGTAALWRRPDRRQIGKILTICGAAMILGMAPWVARNEALFGRFIPTAQSSGYNLWKGFSRLADGSGTSIEHRPDSVREAERIRTSVPFGPDYEHRLSRAFADAMAADLKTTTTGRQVHLVFAKLAMTWLFDWTDPKTHRFGYWGPWSATAVLALLGAALAVTGRVRLDPVILSMSLIMLALLTAAYCGPGVQSRYRMHLEPFEFIFAGLGAQAVLDMMRLRLDRQPPVSRKPAAAQ